MHSLKDVHLSQPFQTHSLCTGKIFFQVVNQQNSCIQRNVGRLHGCAGACDFGQHVFPNNKTSHKFCISLDSACASEEIF